MGAGILGGINPEEEDPDFWGRRVGLLSRLAKATCPDPDEGDAWARAIRADDIDAWYGLLLTLARCKTGWIARRPRNYLPHVKSWKHSESSKPGYSYCGPQQGNEGSRSRRRKGQVEWHGCETSAKDPKIVAQQADAARKGPCKPIKGQSQGLNV
ncbi:hypothetical protein BDV12DRAFT_177882 [Aspergillus spectabilis]